MLLNCRYEREADGLAYMLFAYKLITYLLGAGGSIMTLMGQGVSLVCETVKLRFDKGPITVL